MSYIRVDSALAENGVAVDMLNDGTLFVKMRAARSKAVEAARQKAQAPYRNIILSGRPLPVGISRALGQKITADAVIVGIAGECPDGRTFGKIENGQPTAFEQPSEEYLVALFEAFPDFEEDLTSASQTNATFAAAATIKTTETVEVPSMSEAVEAAAGNLSTSSAGGTSTASI